MSSVNGEEILNSLPDCEDPNYTVILDFEDLVQNESGDNRKYQENEEQSRISQKQHSPGSALPNLKRMLTMDETNTERRRKKTVSSSSSTTIATLSGSLSHRVAPSPVEKLGLAQHIQIWMKSYRKNQEDGAAAVAKAEAAVKMAEEALKRAKLELDAQKKKMSIQKSQKDALAAMFIEN